MRRRSLIGAAMMLLAALAGPADAEPQTPPKLAFLRDLQKALRGDDRGWLADHVHYPLRHHGRMATVIRNKSEFVRNYAIIVSERLRAAVLAQDPQQVFENWQGMMVGDGTHNMWLRESGEGENPRYEIVTINDSD